MTYNEAVDFLFNQLANYHKQGGKAYKPGLEKIQAFCDLMGNPQERFASIHIAGTNGKGSVSHICASVLQEAGYKVGLFTSPHFLDFRERIKINGQQIPEVYVTRFVEAHKNYALAEGITFFEWTTALAFQYFKEENVDIAIIETGLGGRLDSTNVINSNVQIITTIGLDHTEMLGDTLEKIASEKAGIIKPGSIVILGEGNEQITEVVQEVANTNDALFVPSIEETNYLNQSDLHGEFQRANLNTAATVFSLGRMPDSKQTPLPFEVTQEEMLRGFSRIKKNTGLLGRWQELTSEPTLILDIAHNPPAISAALQQIEKVKKERVRIVFGCMSDKDLVRIQHLFPKDYHYYAVSVDHLRALPSADLQVALRSGGLNCDFAGTVSAGISKALGDSNAEDLILVCGSAYVVSEALKENF